MPHTQSRAKQRKRAKQKRHEEHRLEVKAYQGIKSNPIANFKPFEVESILYSALETNRRKH